MSTAFRYCGLEGGACGFGIYAPGPPGDSGKTHAYYDACACAKAVGQSSGLWQLQFLRRKRLQNFVQMRLKSKSGAEIATQGNGVPAHFDVNSSRGAWLRHSPPIFHPAHGPPFFGEV